MSDRMRPMPFGALMDWALGEYRTDGTVFGVRIGPRFPDGSGGEAGTASGGTSGGRAGATPGGTSGGAQDGEVLPTGGRPLFRERVEVPVGPAAGPHTQLAQNIVAAYVSGARFFELKTVQTMDGDDLRRCVPKPCITAGDEGYNCEWSTELTVPDAFAEYVKAWFACKILSRELGLGSPDGFVFNMSVGYSLEGIMSPKIDRFLTDMGDASGTEIFRSCRDWALSHTDRFSRIDAGFIETISPVISRSVTESTLHGCPPAEIEGIARHLIGVKKLHTYVKCNPTLLGYETARSILDGLGFTNIVFGDKHFREDLQWADAVPMLRRLQDFAAENGVDFGVKLTNTCPVDVKAGELPSREMYLSGRALFPLSVTLASRMGEAFGGKLRISYSGGADAHSIRKLVSAGIWPVTVATTLLKPGGYGRLNQLVREIADLGGSPGGASGPDGTSALDSAGGIPAADSSGGAWTGIDPAAVARLSESVRTDPHYRRTFADHPRKKLPGKPPVSDCFTAPCTHGCPIGQDIPAYLRLVRAGQYRDALRVITERNPLPFTTGFLCPHPCALRCTRAFYEGSVSIREAKRTAAEQGFAALLPEIRPRGSRPEIRSAVVGGGPAGMAAAYFLAREGADVTLYEATGTLGGVVRHLIPEFRIPSWALDRDEALLRAMNVKILFHSPVESAEELNGEGYTHVLFATGAQKAGDPGLAYGKCLDFAEVLSALKQGTAPALGTDVAVIGAGNSAMDTARAVLRVPGVERVRIVYRRKRKEAPADPEEIDLAIQEGAEFLELLSPVGVQDHLLTCRVMEPGAPDDSGRRSPVPTDKEVTIPCTAVIAAIGNRIDHSVDVGTWPVIGDRRRGPATVVEAIADAAEAVRGILPDLRFDRYAPMNAAADRTAVREARGVLCGDCASDSADSAGTGVRSAGERCLECGSVCETCAEVCPNRANVSIHLPGEAMPQILHVDDLCNECGNCAVFCPYEGAPYRDKLTLFGTREDFEESENDGFLPLDMENNGPDTPRRRYLIRLDGKTVEADPSDPACSLPDRIRETLRTVETRYPWLLTK